MIAAEHPEVLRPSVRSALMRVCWNEGAVRRRDISVGPLQGSAPVDGAAWPAGALLGNLHSLQADVDTELDSRLGRWWAPPC